MKELFSRAILSSLVMLVTLFSFGNVALAAANPNACPGGNTSKGQVLNGLGETGNGCNDSGVNNILAEAVNILSMIAGAAAVIMTILAGFKYITSGGDANKVGNAKNTLIYALVGVAVAALSQALIHFVLAQSNNVAT